MKHILDLIQQNGPELFYLITFVWTALEGETFVIFAGFAAQRDYLNIYLLFLAAALGSMAGDQICFFLGRFFGKRIIMKNPTLAPKLQKILTLLERHATGFILSYRFMYGVRNISAIAIGMSAISWKRFAFLNAIASFLWSAAFCGGGYLFGNVLERMGLADEDSVNFEVRTFMIAALLLFLLVVALKTISARNRAAAERKEEQEKSVEEGP